MIRTEEGTVVSVTLDLLASRLTALGLNRDCIRLHRR